MAIHVKLQNLAKPLERDEPQNLASDSLDVAQIYSECGSFLWKSLFRMGVMEADLPDALQEVLWVVHRRKESFDGSSKLKTWLFGICLRVAATTRRTRARRRESAWGADVELPMDNEHPESLEAHLRKRDAERKLVQILDQLEPELRALFSLYELENRPCNEIAELLGIPIGTVHSRLSKMRTAFEAARKRTEAERARICGGRL